VLPVPGPDDITLAAWYCNRGRGTPVVILFHGYSAEKTSLLGEARAFFDLGASVMLVDFRGSGGSSESYTTVGVREAEDVAVALHYARRRLSHGNVFLFGRSMGAAAILRAVHAHGTQPDGVILEAVFGPVWPWIWLSEKPGSATFVGGAVIIAALVLHSLYVGRPADKTVSASLKNS
jgi:pimeloyl-ACP methyl ester carboxylesterase